MQEVSNKAAARYDKANSQHMAAKEMIRVAESQLAACRAQHLVSEEPSSPSPLDLAWQEMLNHATDKVSRGCLCKHWEATKPYLQTCQKCVHVCVTV